MRLAHLLCSDGISGDLWLGALIDAGAPVEPLQVALDRSEIHARLIVETANARTVTATRVSVECDGAARVDRLDGLHELVASAGLPDRAEARAHAVVSTLGQAEAEVHGVRVEDVALHELGRPRTGAMIIAGAMALELLQIDAISTGPIAVGSGTVEIAHGRFAVPPPAVMALLKGFVIEGGPRDQELTTPSGAAVLAALAEPVEAAPRLWLESYGRGASGAGDRLRVLTVLIGSARGEQAGHELG